VIARRFRVSPAAASISLALAACTVPAPAHVRPAVPLPKDVPSSLARQVTEVRLTTADPWNAWWEVFKDPNLTALIERARSTSPSIQVARARVYAARSVAFGAKSPMLPQVEANAGYRREKGSVELGGGGGPRTGSFDLWTASADVVWELDLFGAVKYGVAASWADARALDEDRRALEISIAAEVAQAWFDAGAAAEQAQIAKDTAGLLDKTLGLVKARVEAGLVGELDLRRTEGDLASARALIPTFGLARAQAEHRIAILLGEAPGSHYPGKPPAAFAAPPDIPVGLPSALVCRRPDVRAAEQRLIAANSRVGQAIADFYPSVSLVGDVGAAASDIGKLATQRAYLWSIGPSIRIPIFQGGRLAAAKLEAEANKDAATADYVRVLLTALGEVSDAAVGVGTRLAARDRLQESVVAATKAVELANVSYEKGLTGYVNVLDGQRALLTARLALLVAQREVLNELVRLGKALGGGWTE
jgi:NodT family efflux transporter outer membrane factor (OMF) lipoprotein